MEAITVSGAAPTPFPAFVTGEKGKPAVIVIQEWWGITDQIKQQAAKIASQGYRVLLPDLYKGKVGVDAEEAHHMMSNLDFSAATVEIADAAAYLKSEGSPAIGITGFCMGGALTMGGLAKSPDIKCAAPFYGVNFGLFDCATLKDKPVQGHFGQEDGMTGFSDVATAKKLEADLKAAGNTDVEVFIYEKVGHAFMNDSPAPYASFEERKEKLGQQVYDAEQAEKAWGRLFDFFAKHLKA